MAEDLPRKRIVQNSVGVPTEETSDAGLVDAVASYFAANPVEGGGVGIPGPKGDTGDQGPQGEAGPQGPAGADGAVGPKGDKGDRGDDGLDGADGAQGPQGPAGADGAAGAAGPKGDKGDTGPAGSQGPQGLKGDTGAQGPAGSDSWVIVRLSSDFTTSSATSVAVTGFGFTPAANKRYEFEAKLRLRTATATVGPRPGLNWPSGTVDGGVGIWAPNSATTEAIARQPAGVNAMAASTGVPNTTQSWPGFISGEVEVGASPSGIVQVTLASETAGSNVTMKAGSILRYREIA